MVTRNMNPTTFRERFAEAKDRVDREQFVGALRYVRGERPERSDRDEI